MFRMGSPQPSILLPFRQCISGGEAQSSARDSSFCCRRFLRNTSKDYFRCPRLEWGGDTVDVPVHISEKPQFAHVHRSGCIRRRFEYVVVVVMKWEGHFIDSSREFIAYWSHLDDAVPRILVSPGVVL